MLSTQLQNAVIELLSQFITNDFGKLEKLKETHEAASQGKGLTYKSTLSCGKKSHSN